MLTASSCSPRAKPVPQLALRPSDTPAPTATLAVADASILASQVDGAVLVVGVGETRREMLTQAILRLKSVGVQPMGVVLNKLTQRKSGYYYYYYYRYASRYGDGTETEMSSSSGNNILPNVPARRKKSSSSRKR